VALALFDLNFEGCLGPIQFFLALGELVGFGQENLADCASTFFAVSDDPALTA